MPSVKRGSQLAILLLCGAIAAGGLGGCSTTQEKAAAHQAESERILEAREKRQERKKQQKLEKEREKG
ncbi:MAG TPA: hypothetical protein VF504_05850 [Solirubrobacterales bacterium]